MGKFLRIINGAARQVEESGTPTIYEETYSVNSTITTGTPITLPASGTYNSDDLEVYLNGQKLDSLVDYNYVGSVPRTQVSFTFDLLDGDDVLFRKARNF